MLDRYWDGPAARLSPEAPVPVVQVANETLRAGGAANVAMNLRALGASCTLLGWVGADREGDLLLELLAGAGVDCRVQRIEGGATVTKLRVTSRKQQLLRLDFERPWPAPAAEQARAELDALMAAAAGDHDVVVLSDYGKGVLDAPDNLLAAAREAGVPVMVDPKAPPFGRWRSAALIKPNLRELELAVGVWSGEEALRSRAQNLLSEHGIDHMLLTRGEAGMTLLARTGEPLHLPGRAVDVFDVTGAGDTVMAVLAASRAAGASLPDAARLSNLAASLAVRHAGTTAVGAAELASAWAAAGADGFERDRGSVSRERLGELLAAARARGERIVFTNGCFDLLHAGHVGYLEQARALGDRLVVAINDDDSVRRLKGPGRPLNPATQRARVLAGLAAVDWVVTFAEDTPESLLQALAPDVLVKGGDYGIDEVVGADIVRSQGGEVRVLDRFENLSSSAIVERARRSGSE